ncbi:MAG TPA: glutathione S-transferase N-terminal domain-containing protein [Roseiarcus sp.]|nr:glutathione S-transferase N-terminal domain-containing protein [Roseiarcus sp.]
MNRFIVHGIPGSPFSRAVLATLEEKGADYRLVALAVGMIKVEPHISRHPFGRVPVLEHDGFMLYGRRRSCATSIACCLRRL